MRTKSHVMLDYDEAATSYDRIRFESAGGRFADQVEKDLLKRIVEGRTALEIGTATGRFAVLILRMGYEYTGVDLSRAMLKETSRRTNFEKERASLLQMDAEAMAFRPYFENVICIRTFHFLLHPSQALENIRKAMKKGGRCLVTFETDNPLRRLVLMLDRRSEQRYYKRKEVEDLFNASGLRVIDSGPVLRIPVTLYRRCPKKLLRAMNALDHIWPWPTHEFVLGEAI
jgi:ubiquinone/menaquinone biosynthesis C-methylase UbiE